MKVNLLKQERQIIGVSKWEAADYNGCLSYYPGVGKTYTAFLAIKRIESFNKGVYLIVVPSEVLLMQWKKKIEGFFNKGECQRIVVITINKLLQDGCNYSIDTLIIDEVHEFHTPEKQRIFNKILVNYKRLLVLTGSEDDKNFWKLNKYFKVVDRIDREEAIEKGFIADSIEYNLGVHLTEEERYRYDKYSLVITELLEIFKGDLSYANLVLRGGSYNNSVHYAGPSWAMGLAVKHGYKPTLDATITEDRLILEKYNPNKFVTYANNLLNCIRYRKELLYNASNKINITLGIMNRFNKVKTIIFSESTDFSDKIGAVLNANNHPTVVFHSKMKTTLVESPISGKLIKLGATRLKRNAIESINNGKARVLSTTKSLDRGLDIPDLRLAITTSGTGNETQYKQRSNRTTRKEEDSIHADIPVLIINLYAINTQEQKWLKSRQYHSKHEIVDITIIDDIMHTPASNSEFL